MEKRAALAFALSIGLLMAYLWVMQTYFEPPRPTPTPPTDAPTPPSPTPTPARPEPAAPPLTRPTPARPSEGPRPAQKIAPLSAPLYRAVVSSEGGKLQDWTLHYRGEKPMVVVGEQGPLGLLVGPDAASARVLPMTLSPESLVLGSDRPTGDLVLTGEAGGLSIRQTLRFRADDYVIDAVLRVENPTSAPRSITLALPWIYRHLDKAPLEKFAGQRPSEIVVSAQHEIRRGRDLAHPGWSERCLSTFTGPNRDKETIDEKADKGDWIAIGSTWYLAALIPRTPGFHLVAAAAAGPPTAPASGEHASPGTTTTTVAVHATPMIAPGQAWEGEVLLY